MQEKQCCLRLRVDIDIAYKDSEITISSHSNIHHLQRTMSTRLFSARFMAGHVTTLFGYSRGLKDVLVATLFEALERNNHAVNSTGIGRIAGRDDGTTCEQPQNLER